LISAGLPAGSVDETEKQSQCGVEQKYPEEIRSFYRPGWRPGCQQGQAHEMGKQEKAKRGDKGDRQKDKDSPERFDPGPHGPQDGNSQQDHHHTSQGYDNSLQFPGGKKRSQGHPCAATNCASDKPSEIPGKSALSWFRHFLEKCLSDAFRYLRREITSRLKI